MVFYFYTGGQRGYFVVVTVVVVTILIYKMNVRSITECGVNVAMRLLRLYHWDSLPLRVTIQIYYMADMLVHSSISVFQHKVHKRTFGRTNPGTLEQFRKRRRGCATVPLICCN